MPDNITFVAVLLSFAFQSMQLLEEIMPEICQVKADESYDTLCMQ